MSESRWKREYSVLEEDANTNSILRKEINKETEIDTSVQQSISKKIESLNQNAAALAQKLEKEKHKNLELQAIINYIHRKMESQHFKEATHREDTSFQSLNSLQSKLKKYEYDLGHLNSKANRMAENVELKRGKITQSRTERVIDSGIFRNIQKQLIDSEFKFKKLLIQKVKYQKEYQKLVSQYQELKRKADSYCGDKVTSKQQKSKNPENIITLETNIASPPPKKFIELENLGKTNAQKNFFLNHLDQQIESQQQRKIITIRKMLSQLGLGSCEQLLLFFKDINTINEECFSKMNKYGDQTSQIEQSLAQIHSKRQSDGIRFCEAKKQMTKHQVNYHKCLQARAKVQSLQESIQQELNQLSLLFEQNNFKKLLQEVELQPTILEGRNIANFDEMQQILQLTQQSIQQYLRQCPIAAEDKRITQRAVGQQKLQQLINKVHRHQQCGKVMKKEQFQQQYHKIVKNVEQRSNTRSLAKKKSGFLGKR